MPDYYGNRVTVADTSGHGDPTSWKKKGPSYVRLQLIILMFFITMHVMIGVSHDMIDQICT